MVGCLAEDIVHDSYPASLVAPSRFCRAALVAEALALLIMPFLQVHNSSLRQLATWDLPPCSVSRIYHTIAPSVRSLSLNLSSPPPDQPAAEKRDITHPIIFDLR